MSFRDEIEKSKKEVNVKLSNTSKNNSSDNLFDKGSDTTFGLNSGRPVNEGTNIAEGNNN